MAAAGARSPYHFILAYRFDLSLACAAIVQAWPAAIDYSVSDHRMVLATFELV